MSKVQDEELKKAFAELHDKIIDTNQKLKISDLQIENLKRNKGVATLTEVELRTVPNGVKTYEAVGRMFLLQDLDTIRTDLKNRAETAEKKIKALESNKEYLQNNLKECENHIREMVQRKQNQESDN